jgi:hypothetical protein
MTSQVYSFLTELEKPATGGDMMLEAKKVVTLKCSGKLRKRINVLYVPERCFYDKAQKKTTSPKGGKVAF